jgi:DNA-binding NtrC family response regulator
VANATQNASATVLVVDDDEQVRDFVSNLLRNAGFSVRSARDGAEAMTVAAGLGDGPDLLLSDMLLPQVSGYDLAVSLRQTKPGLKVVFMTGYVEGDIVQRCVSELNAGFLDKPFAPAALLSLVRDQLKQHAG